MRRISSYRLLLSIGVCLHAGLVSAQVNQPIIVQANKPGVVIQPTMYGIFFEDINFAADGGIYAELVKNRSFEFAEPLMGWDKRNQDNKGNVLIINRGAVYASNPRYARVTVLSDTGDYYFANEGFRGMGIKKDNGYEFSVQAKQLQGVSEQLTVELLNEKKEIIGKGNVTIAENRWKRYAISITATATASKASMRLWFHGKGVTDIDMVSLFPKDTWKNRPGGLRNDLVQLLADMKPGFIRFPGGCIVEGRDLANRYQWKKTVGDIDKRELIINRWNTEFKNHATPDYFQSFGLGFYEYFLLSEDIGATPLPIINCGMACQYNSAEVVPVDELDPYMQDALDLIEFANGSADTKWGKLRTDMGHPAPFNLKMIGVGNEQWGPQYIERYRAFAVTIHNKYPDIKLVTGLGPSASGPLFDYLNPVLRKLKADIMDEHYYLPPEWFQQNARRYDSYDREGPKIFAGEYAAHIKGTEGEKRSTWWAALSEAAFMTGLERNADVVHMSSYAPLFAHADAWQWAPDLIWYDNLRSYGTPSYYVQQLFSVNKGSKVVPVSINKEVIAGQDSLYATASVDTISNELIIKLVNISAQTKIKQLVIEGIHKKTKAADMIVLSGDTGQLNVFDEPKAISPVKKTIAVKGKNILTELAPYSLTIVRVKINKSK